MHRLSHYRMIKKLLELYWNEDDLELVGWNDLQTLWCEERRINSSQQKEMERNNTSYCYTSFLQLHICTYEFIVIQKVPETNKYINQWSYIAFLYAQLNFIKTSCQMTFPSVTLSKKSTVAAGTHNNWAVHITNL